MTARGKLDHGPGWYISAGAQAAIDAAIAADHRRTWDPRGDSPSLASLAGKAKDYGAHYRGSRDRLLQAAGVRVRKHYARTTGALAYIVTMPGEPLSAAIRVDRGTRTITGGAR